jgi:hypothetical protein
MCVGMPNLTRLGVLLAGVLLLSGRAARADEATERTGYRLQILASDGVAAAAFFGGNAVESDGAAGDVLMATGGVTYLLGGPVIHAVHHNYGRAAISLGLRVLLPIIGANIGVAASGCQDHQSFANLCYVDDMAAGFLIGAATAAAADILLVAPGAHGAGPEVDEPGSRNPPAGLSLAPRMVATGDHAMFGLGGRF